jgi:hypothetical protein
MSRYRAAADALRTDKATTWLLSASAPLRQYHPSVRTKRTLRTFLPAKSLKCLGVGISAGQSGRVPACPNGADIQLEAFSYGQSIQPGGSK